MAKGFIFLLLLTTLQNLVPAQTIEIQSAIPLNVTEIRRVMPDGDGTKDARNYATQVTAVGLPSLEGTYSFKLQFVDADLSTHSIIKDVALKSNDSVQITFDITIPEEATHQFLSVMNGTLAIGTWSGKFNISDTQARVAVIADSYLRVTTGTLDNVTIQDKPELSCLSTESPCYYSKENFGESFPPLVPRCVNLEYDDKKGKNSLKYCDDTFSDLSSLVDEPTRILLDDTNLNLRYPPTNNTYEVLVVENGSLSNKETVHFCFNSEISNNGCEANITKPESDVDFVIATFDQSDFVEGSQKYSFDIFPVEVKRLTDDSVIASWISKSENAFQVFIKTESDLDDFEYYLNRTCPESAEDRCESLFISVTKEDDRIAVVQNGKNAIGKTITEEPAGQSNITRISKTQEDNYSLTFMVQNKFSGLPSVKLIEVDIADDRLVRNTFYNGSVSNISQGYLFNTNEVSGTFDSERKFYLVEYDSGSFSNVPDRCGVAYVTFVDYNFELYWVRNGSYVVRGLAYSEVNVTVGSETCSFHNPCYVEVNERDDVNICTVIPNSAPSGGTLEQCEDKTPSTPSELGEDPTVILIDNLNLNLRYNSKTKFEVLALSMDGHMISKDQNFDCEENAGGCSLSITLANDSALLDFIIVSIALNNKTLLGSKGHPFENTPLDTWYLTKDAVIANWTQAENENFSASIRIKSDLDNDKYSFSQRCESEVCEYFFIISETREESEYLAMITTGKNAVAKTVVKEPPTESTIVKISKSDISDSTSSTTFTVNGAAPVPSEAKLIEVSGSEKEVVNILYDGAVTGAEGTLYEFVTSGNISFDGQRKFLLVEYIDDKVMRAGPAYVTFVDYDFELYWVSNERYVMRGFSYGENDITVGSKACYKHSPCYVEVEVNKENKAVSICTAISNSAQGVTLDQCEDQTPLTPSELEQDPKLLLIDNSHLNLRYDTAAIFEVLALDVKGHMIPENKDFACKKTDGGCSLNVTLTNDTTMVEFTIVSVTESKNFLSSKARPFEIVELEARYLTGDAVLTNWTSKSKSGKEFSAAILNSTLDYKYISDMECSGEGDDSCVYFFTEVDQSENYVAIVQNGSDVVGKTIRKDTPSQLEILTISRTIEEENNSTTFIFKTNSTPSSANLIEVKKSEGGVLANLETRGEVSPMEEHYQFKCSSDIGSLEDERNFLLVEYDANNKVKKAGAVYVENKFDVDLVWIFNTTILRERVLDDKTVSIGDETCNSSTSPCYHSAFSSDVKHVPLCTQAKNHAKGPKDTVEVCEDQKPDTPGGLTVNNLQLQDDKDGTGSITLSAACIETSDHVGLALFSKEKLLNGAEIDCIKNNDSTCCHSNAVPLTNSSQALDLVVVCTSGGNVTESGHKNVEHLKFSVSKLDGKSMAVHWTAANADEYVATLEASGMLGKAEERSSEVHCDSEDSCYSTFFDLDLTVSYQLSVHKEGDNSSSTGTNIEPLDTSPEPSHMYITKVSRVSDTSTKVSLDKKCEDVNIVVNVPEGNNMLTVSGEGTVTDYTYKIFKFSHDVPIFDKKNAIFAVLDKEKEQLPSTGTAILTLADLDATVAWVGAERDTKGASLRVDVGSQGKVQLGNLLCGKESSPCYFLEVERSDLPGNFERCVENGNISQCNEEVTPFTAMDAKDVTITLEGNVVEVVASLSESNAKIELKVYDPSAPKTVFSEGNVTCEYVVGDEGLLTCTQAVQLPNGQRDLKVIVTEISIKGIALKSSITYLTVPGIESWVIVVSVLGALILAATGSYFTVIYVRKKKSREWESDAIAKEVEVIDSIYSEVTAVKGDQEPHMPSRANGHSTSESSITLPEEEIISQRPHIPDRRQDYYSERPFARGRAPIPDGRLPHSQSPNELLDRRPPTYPKPRYPLGHRNEAFVPSEPDSVGDLQPTRQSKVKLSSKINVSSLQKIANYQQSRV
ncbi:uncharacterized protein [Macrobrachium rosenbergii]|uniref:uncharacterized protein n=1 Tax=Macrobrachium rosenbergii TaxID=79674 RepID=UPI0034D6929A